MRDTLRKREREGGERERLCEARKYFERGELREDERGRERLREEERIRQRKM